jgi:two-component system sensor histidine kinase KdpD
VSYGASCAEFDLDARWRGAPAILLVDELAALESAPAGSAAAHPQALAGHRGAARAGIDVWTTVNVQHLESLNDVVAQITGVRQRETLAGSNLRRRPTKSN